MKHYILYSICILVSLFASCNDDQSSVAPTGILYLNVEEDATLLTRAETEVTYESLQVAILKGEEDTLRVYNDYLTEVKGERLVLPVGKYTIVVRSNGANAAGWEKPLYQGQEEIEVKQGEITNTKVVCKIANTKVSVVYDPKMKDHFVDYQTTVTNSSGSLIYTQDEYRSGFFTPEKLTVQLKLVNNDGNTFTLKKVYPEIQPQYHYKFEFTLAISGPDDEAGADMDVTIDDEHKEINYNIFIKKENMFEIGPPSIASEGFKDGVYSHKVIDPKPESGKLLLTYKLGRSNSLMSFDVTATSTDFTGLSKFNMVDEAQATAAHTLGFPLLSSEPIKSEADYTTYQLDLAELVSKLSCVDNKPTLHTFAISLIDDKYQEATVQFAIRIMPDVKAYVMEPYCWSTFAVLQGFGAEDCYFVLTTPDGQEIEITDQSKIKHDEEGNMSVLVTDLKPGAYSYQIFSESDVSVATEKSVFAVYDPITGTYNVPNLGFEDWNTITKNRLYFPPVVGIAGKDYLAPNKTNDFNDVYWESGNYGSSARDVVLAQNTSDVAISSSSNKLAAVLKSAYVGVAAINMGAFSAGSVFIGTPTKVSSEGAELRYGHPHIGFPTHLSGYYKYTPGTINYIDNSKGSGGTDKAIIYIALSTKPFDLKSLTAGSIVRFDKTAKEIFAYGELIEENKVSEYKKFDIRLTYLKNKDCKMPTYSEFVGKDGTPKIYIIIVATCSIDGDKFTGSTDSELYIDEFSLNYDYNADSFKGTQFENFDPVNITTK